MTSTAGAGLFDALDGDRAIDALVADAALVRAMVDVEAALARASALAGIIPAEAAVAITAALADATPDVADLAARSLAAGNPVVPLVGDLGRLLPASARTWLHYGATSQDVLDTALMVVAARAVDATLDQVSAATTAASLLADSHRYTLMVARTLGQQALPTTFGVKAAGWAAGLDAGRTRLAQVRRDRLAVQLGGAAGTLAAFGSAGPRVAGHLATELERGTGVALLDAGVPWHTERSRVHELAAALGSLTAAAGKLGTDVVLLAQSEVGEVTEGGDPGDGGSSAMPHKRNPVTAVLLRAAAVRTPGLVATLLSAAGSEHERGAGPWHAEWAVLRDLLRLTGGSASRAATLLVGLHVDVGRMQRNLVAAGPAVLSESVANRLTASLGRSEAQRVVRAALRSSLADDPAIRAALGDAELADALEPSGYLGAAELIIDRTLDRVRANDRAHAAAAAFGHGNGRAS